MWFFSECCVRKLQKQVCFFELFRNNRWHFGPQYFYCMCAVDIVVMNQTGMFVTVYAVILKITKLWHDGLYTHFMHSRRNVLILQVCRWRCHWAHRWICDDGWCDTRPSYFPSQSTGTVCAVCAKFRVYETMTDVQVMSYVVFSV